jgi:hypothetical protein
MIARLIVLGVLGAALIAAPAARADHQELHLPLFELLPPQPTPTSVQPRPPVIHCGQRPDIACVERVVAEMTRRWEPLDIGCDHRAVFALTYLRTTEGFLATLRADPNFFQDFDYVVWEDVLFADYYYRAYDAYGRPGAFVPDAWRTAFHTNLDRDANAGQDLLLGMNAHIQRDLPYVLAELGLRKPDGTSRKPDHDKVNRILTRVLDPIEDELAERYDPFIREFDAKPSPHEEVTFLELMKSWREGAWRNAERLLNAQSPGERAVVEQSIETNARQTAQEIAASEQPGYRAQRDAYCRARVRERGGGRAFNRARARHRPAPARGLWRGRTRGATVKFRVYRRRGSLRARGKASFRVRCSGRRGGKRRERFNRRIRRRNGVWSFVHSRRRSPRKGRAGREREGDVLVVFQTARRGTGTGRVLSRALSARHRQLSFCTSRPAVWRSIKHVPPRKRKRRGRRGR